VCVGTSDMTTVSDDPSSIGPCVLCIGLSPRGVLGGAGMPPLGYAQHSTMGEFFFGRFFLFLEVL
jgi:hypothetical protein